jgi:cytochrome b subunit of formate dehydrogenase
VDKLLSRFKFNERYNLWCHISIHILLLLTGKGLLKSITKVNYFKAAIICASYFTVVLSTYDFVYLKLYLGKSIYYLIDYWYLTIFSPIAFLIFLPIGYNLDKQPKN